MFLYVDNATDGQWLLREAESLPFQDEHSHRLSIAWWSAPDM